MEIMTTVQLADLCKSVIGKESSYALAKCLDMSPEAVRCWYKRGTVMDDEVGLDIADLTGLDPELVILWLQIERSEKRGSDKMSQHWRHIAQQIAA
ncbi:hypothetical protein [Alloalcanivorax mobilis]|uniref:hypothetical protein n=1 Tax=Alloalcanivorax mobilis TaxID=2019569 RepID=UPI000C7930C5|nr:hypothetical protein [Alloalcanivorax mobilis]